MKYIALLRGINVGGKNKISMRDLKTCFENAGFLNTMTYINSGNVIFDSEIESTTKLSKRCEEIIEEEFGFPIRVTIIDVNTLKEALDHVPEWWGDDPNSKHNAIFVIQPATAKEVSEEVGEIKIEYERIYVYKDIIFWSAPLKSFSRTQWAKVAGKKVYNNITIRNANTTKKLLELVLS